MWKTVGHVNCWKRYGKTCHVLSTIRLGHADVFIVLIFENRKSADVVIFSIFAVTILQEEAVFSVLTERVIGVDELPFDILQQWGSHRSEVRFYLRHQEGVPVNGENGM